MASEDVVKEVVKRLLLSPLAYKPKPLTGDEKEDIAKMIQELARVFYLTLEDIPDDLLIAATVHCIATERAFPSVADLRGAAVGLVNRADGVPDPYTAWRQVKDAIRSGSYKTVARVDENDNLVFQERGGCEIHPLARMAIDSLGGLKAFADSPADDEGQWRARFISSYQTYRNRQIEDSMMLPQITGYIQERRELNGNSVKGLIEAAAQKLKATV